MQRKNGRRKKIAYVLCGILAVVLFSGCQSTAADGTDEKVFVYGDTTFNAENDESDVNPHNGYSGWACIRYGIGETLFHYSDSMEIEPWLAESYELVDDTTWRITLHEGISFTSGRTLDAEAVKENMMKKKLGGHHGGCPGSRLMTMNREENAPSAQPAEMQSRLRQWPVQIKLVPVNAPYFDGAKLLIAADCTAYAYAAFHEKFIKNHITLVGCPKLDSVDYSEKLTEIIANNNIKSVTVVRMEVPCCGGLEHAAKTALQNSGKFIPWQVVTISTDGRILD